MDGEPLADPGPTRKIVSQLFLEPQGNQTLWLGIEKSQRSKYVYIYVIVTGSNTSTSALLTLFKMFHSHEVEQCFSSQVEEILAKGNSLR
ncbi:Sporulation initiation inhibitor protein Soj [Clarias magur]|uniref:Sporulation initiation inhibitor protein Soj n=1 Tax=Clarias magur TaxID=1594786 RepID=A0A8J4TW07_CLAMG|nr:Sporulation initiation inhibitor protein Soj [Clarias magur]